jgi:hypothetical protein
MGILRSPVEDTAETQLVGGDSRSCPDTPRKPDPRILRESRSSAIFRQPLVGERYREERPRPEDPEAPDQRPRRRLRTRPGWPASDRVGSAPAASGRAASRPFAPEEPASEPAAFREPAPEPAAFKEPASDPAAFKEPAPEPAAFKEPAPEPAALKEPKPEPPAAEEPASDPAAPEEPAPEPAASTKTASAGRLATALASAASAWARCSACGRDTSLARIAALVVTFIAAIGPFSHRPKCASAVGQTGMGRAE